MNAITFVPTSKLLPAEYLESSEHTTYYALDLMVDNKSVFALRFVSYGEGNLVGVLYLLSPCCAMPLNGMGDYGWCTACLKSLEFSEPIESYSIIFTLIEVNDDISVLTLSQWLILTCNTPRLEAILKAYTIYKEVKVLLKDEWPPKHPLLTSLLVT